MLFLNFKGETKLIYLLQFIVQESSWETSMPKLCGRRKQIQISKHTFVITLWEFRRGYIRLWRKTGLMVVWPEIWSMNHSLPSDELLKCSGKYPLWRRKPVTWRASRDQSVKEIARVGQPGYARSFPGIAYPSQGSLWTIRKSKRSDSIWAAAHAV